jgi:hypothetical protein
MSEQTGPNRLPFLIAVALTLLLYFLPVGRSLTYPFLLFATFVHESSHAVATVLTLGHVDSLTVALDGSGLTMSRGGVSILVSSAGYVGTALFGGLLLVLSRDGSRTRITLVGCAILAATVTAAFVGHTSNLIVLPVFLSIILLVSFSIRKGWRLLIPAAVLLAGLLFYLAVTASLFSWTVGLLIPLVLLAVARFSSEKVAHFFLTFLSVQCLLNSVEALRTLLFISVNGKVHSDAQNMATMTHLPAALWALAWTAFAMLILLVSLRLYFSPPRAKAVQAI